MNDPLDRITELLNEALQPLLPRGLADERLFVRDESLSHATYQRYTLQPGQSSLALMFELYTTGISFYIDRSAEIPEWSYAWIQAHPALFQQEIVLLFSSTVLVEHQGKKTCIRLFDAAGAQVRHYTYTTGIGLNFLQKRVFTLYSPLIAPALVEKDQQEAS
jgi:hypothetical protein